MYNPRDGYTHPKPASVVPFQTNILWSPRLASVPLQAADLYARRVHPVCMHPQRPGQANHPPRSQPPAQGTDASPTRWCQAPAHPPGSHNPTCKRPVHPLSLSPGHPHRQVRLQSRRGPATLARRGPRHTHGRPRDPAGRGGGAGRDGLGGGRPLPPWPGRPPSYLPRPGTCGQRDPWGTPLPARASPKRSSPPPPGARSRPLQGLRREADRAGYLRSPWRRRRRRWRVRTARGGRTQRAGRAGGAATPVSRRRRRVPGPAECRRGAPAH